MSLTEVVVLLSTLLTIGVLGFSTFVSVYSNFLHNSEMAEVNWHLYEGQAEITINSNAHEVSNYQKTADSWHKLSKEYGNAAELRRCSANLCLWSIIATIIGFLIAFWWGNWLIIPVGVSVVLLLLAVGIFLCEKACPLMRRLLKWPIGRGLKGAKPL